MRFKKDEEMNEEVILTNEEKYFIIATLRHYLDDDLYLADSIVIYRRGEELLERPFVGNTPSIAADGRDEIIHIIRRGYYDEQPTFYDSDTYDLDDVCSAYSEFILG